MDAKLVIVGGQANKSEVKLKLPMLIGRNPGLGLTINHNMVSRVHCQIYEREGALVVRDNNSSNGTLINNERISESVLKPGDRLAVGPLTFVAIYQHNGAFPTVGREGAKTAPAAAPKPAPAKPAANMNAPVIKPMAPPAGGPKPMAPPSPKPGLPQPPKPMAPPAAPAAPAAAGGQWSDSLFEDANTADDLLFGRDEQPASPASPFSKYTEPTVEEEEGTRFFAPGTSFKELDLADLVADTDDSQSAANIPPVPAAAASDDFQFLIQFENAGDIQPGTAIRAAGRDAGVVKDLKYVMVGGQLKAQALASVSKQLAPHLRDDMNVAIQQSGLSLVVEVLSPGQGNPIVAGQMVTAYGIQAEYGGLADLVDDDSSIMAPGSLSHTTANDDLDDMGVLDGEPNGGDDIMAPPAKGGGLNDFFAELTSGLDDDDEEEAPAEAPAEEEPPLQASFEDLADDDPPMATLDVEDLEELPPESGATNNGENGSAPNQGFSFGDFDMPGRR